MDALKCSDNHRGKYLMHLFTDRALCFLISKKYKIILSETHLHFVRYMFRKQNAHARTHASNTYNAFKGMPNKGKFE